MDTTAPPYNDVRVRQAMKLLIDRPKALSSAVSGYGLIANDIMARWDPLYDSALPQRKYDPEQAVALLKAAGQDQTEFNLHTSAVQSELVPQALVMAEGAKNAGVKLTVTTDPADSFWDKAYGHVPFSFSSIRVPPVLRSVAQLVRRVQRVRDEVGQRREQAGHEAGLPGRQDVRSGASQGDRLPGAEDPVGRRRLHRRVLQGAHRRALAKVKGLKPYAFPFLGWYHFWDAWLA